MQMLKAPSNIWAHSHESHNPSEQINEPTDGNSSQHMETNFIGEGRGGLRSFKEPY